MAKKLKFIKPDSYKFKDEQEALPVNYIAFHELVSKGETERAKTMISEGKVSPIAYDGEAFKTAIILDSKEIFEALFIAAGEDIGCVAFGDPSPIHLAVEHEVNWAFFRLIPFVGGKHTPYLFAEAIHSGNTDVIEHFVSLIGTPEQVKADIPYLASIRDREVPLTDILEILSSFESKCTALSNLMIQGGGCEYAKYLLEKYDIPIKTSMFRNVLQQSDSHEIQTKLHLLMEHACKDIINEVEIQIPEWKSEDSTLFHISSEGEALFASLNDRRKLENKFFSARPKNQVQP